MADAIELNEEEKVAVEKARRDLEAAKLAVGQPQPQPRDPLWLLTDEGQKVLASNLGRDERGNQRPVNADRSTVVIPKSFVLALTHHHKFDFQQGIREVPAALLTHPWVMAHGVSAYKSTIAKPAPEILMGSQTMSDPVKVGSRDMPLGPFVVAAHTASGKTVSEWNAMSDADRDAAIQMEVTKVIDAAKPDPVQAKAKR